MNCKHCAKPTTNHTYCSNKCQHDVQMAKRRKDLLEGKYIGKHLSFGSSSWTREVLIDLYGYKCNGGCGITEWWNNKPITLEVNHKDGVASNNDVTNLEFLCANCHSQTPTFRALNKHSTRKR